MFRGKFPMLKSTLAGALLSAALAASLAAPAQGPEDVLVNRFTAFSGSQQNAASLVAGLRNGAEITLLPTAPGCPVVKPPAPLPPKPVPGLPPPPPPSLPPSLPEPVTFTPPTGNMGWGIVNIALRLAQEQLVRVKLDKPTPRQIHASLMGGTVTTCAGVSADLEGVLVLRVNGQGWGKLAGSLGLDIDSAK